MAGEIVSGTYFPVLGVGAALGRMLTPDDDQLPGGHPVAVISYGFWVSGFAADPGVVNSSLIINGHPYTVVGVAQHGFDGIEVGRPAQVFVPMMMKAQLTPGWNALDERCIDGSASSPGCGPASRPNRRRPACRRTSRR